MRDEDLKRSWLNFILLSNVPVIYESKVCASFILLASVMRRGDIGKPIEHEVQNLQNDERIKLIIKRKPFSGFDQDKSSQPSERRNSSGLFTSVRAAKDERKQAFVAETTNGRHANLYQQNGKLSRAKRRFESEEEQPQKKFRSSFSYEVEPEAAAVDETRSNGDLLNVEKCRKFSFCKQNPDEQLLRCAVDRPPMPLSYVGYRKKETSCYNGMPIRSLNVDGRNLSYGFTNVDDRSKCAAAGDRVGTASEREITNWDDSLTKVKSVPVGRLKKVSGCNSSNLLTSVDDVGNRLPRKTLPVSLPLPQLTALTLHQQQRATRSTTPLPQRQTTLSTNATSCQQKSTTSNPFKAEASKAVSFRGQRKTALTKFGTRLRQRQTMQAADATLCQSQTTLTTASDRGIQTDPRLLGPCEAGTHIRLDSTILACDKKGHLVISASWRGRTLSGFLMEVKPESSWASQRERVTEPEPSAGRLDRKCKRNITYTEKQKRRRARKVAGQESQGMPLMDEMDVCQEMERGDSNEQWQQLTSEEYVPCPIPGCCKKYVNETALRYHVTADHRPNEDSLNSCGRKQETAGRDCGRLPTDDVTHISNFKKRVAKDKRNGRRISREAQLSECVQPVSNSLSSCGKDGVKVTEMTPVDTVPEFSMSLDTSPRFDAPVDSVPNVSTVPAVSMSVDASPRFLTPVDAMKSVSMLKDTLSPNCTFTKIRRRCDTSVDTVLEFSTSSVSGIPKFSSADKLQQPYSEPSSSYADRVSAYSACPALYSTHGYPPSLITSMLELHPVTDSQFSDDVHDRASSAADANSSNHQLHTFTILQASSNTKSLHSPAKSASKCAAVSAGDMCLWPGDTKFSSASVRAAVNRSNMYLHLDDADSTSVPGVLASSIVGDLATLSFGDEYKSLGSGGSILGPEVNDLLVYDDSDNRLSVTDCRTISHVASRTGSASSVSEGLLTSVGATPPTGDSVHNAAVNMKLSSRYDSKTSFVCNEKTVLADNSRFLVNEGHVDMTEFLTVPVDMTNITDNSHMSSLNKNSWALGNTVGSSGNAKFLLCEGATVLLDEKTVHADSQRLPPSTNLKMPASQVNLDKSSVLTVNEHLQTSSGENFADEIEFVENLPSGHEYRTCVLDAFHLPDASLAFSDGKNGYLQRSPIIENLQAFSTMDHLTSVSICENLQAPSCNDILDASYSGDDFSTMFDRYLYPSRGAMTTEDEACTLSEKASVGGVLKTNSRICFGAEVPSTANEAHLVNKKCFTTENDAASTPVSCDLNGVKSKEFQDANARSVDIVESHGGNLTLCYEPVSPASSSDDSPTHQSIDAEPYSARATSSSSLGSNGAIIDEQLPLGKLMIDEAAVTLSSPTRESDPVTCMSEPPTISSKIVYDLSDISDPEDDAPNSMNFDPNCPPSPWLQQLGKSGYGPSMFPSVLPSDVNYSYTNFCSPPGFHSSSSTSITDLCFERASGGSCRRALDSQIGAISGPSQSSGSTKTMLENLPQHLQVSQDWELSGRTCSTSSNESRNLAACLLPVVDCGDMVEQSSKTSAIGTYISLEGKQDFQSNGEDTDSRVQHHPAWSSMFYPNDCLSEHTFNKQYAKVLDSNEDYSGLQGFNSASIVCDKYNGASRTSSSTHHPEAKNFASLPDSVNSASLYTSNVSSLDSFLETLDDLQDTSVRNYSCNTQIETTSDLLTFEVDSST